MGTSHAHPGDGRRGEGPLRRTVSIDGGGDGAGQALPRLLAETVDSLGGRDDAAPWAAVLTKEDRQRLAAAVARRGAAALDESLVADMVEAVLPEALAAMVEGPASRRRLAEQIARSLLDDPRSAARLQALVSALVESAAGAGGHSGRGAP